MGPVSPRSEPQYAEDSESEYESCGGVSDPDEEPWSDSDSDAAASGGPSDGADSDVEMDALMGRLGQDSSFESEDDSDDEQEDEAAAAAAAGGGGGSPASIEGTADWYRQKEQEPLFPGAHMSVIQTCFVLLSLKRRHYVRDNLFKELLCLLRLLLPAGNLLPPSLYLLKRTVG